MKVEFRLTEESRKEYLARGIEKAEHQVIDVDFSQLKEEDRTIILDNAILRGDVVSLFYMQKVSYIDLSYEYKRGVQFLESSSPLLVNSAEIENIIAELKSLPSRIEAREKEFATIDFNERIETDLGFYKDFSGTPKLDEILNRQRYSDEQKAALTKRFNELLAEKVKAEKVRAEYNKKVQELYAISNRIADEKEAILKGYNIEYMGGKINTEKKQKEVLNSKNFDAALVEYTNYLYKRFEDLNNKNQQDEEPVNRLLAWAKINGSELLKARIEEGMNWKSRAIEEYFNSILPAGFEFMSQSREAEWENATLEAITEMRKLRAELKDKEYFKNISLSIYQEESESEEDCDDYEGEGDTKYYAIDITLKSIDGFEKTFTKRLQ